MSIFNNNFESAVERVKQGMAAEFDGLPDWLANGLAKTKVLHDTLGQTENNSVQFFIATLLAQGKPRYLGHMTFSISEPKAEEALFDSMRQEALENLQSKMPMERVKLNRLPGCDELESNPVFKNFLADVEMQSWSLSFINDGLRQLKYLAEASGVPKEVLTVIACLRSVADSSAKMSRPTVEQPPDCLNN